jgi:hypothetical protein
MKRTIFLLILAAASFSVQAQKTKKISGYGAATADINNMASRTNLNVGAYGGVLLNHKWLIGAAGSNTFLRKTINGNSQSFQYHNYGLYTEYHLNPEKPVHLVAGLMAGAGYLQAKQAVAGDKYSRVGDWHYLITPNVGLSVNVTKFMRVHTRVSYHFAGDTKYSDLTSRDLRSLSGGVALVFGSF